MSGPTNSPSQVERDEVRARVIARVPSWYSPWAHLLIPSTTGLLMIVAAIWLMHDVKLWELACALPFFVVINAGEWRIHRDLLHKRTPGFTVLYDRHTPEHHVIYVTHDMSIRSRKEWRLVLIPAFGVLAALAFALAIPALLIFVAHQLNVGLVILVTTISYVIGYEWLHLSYHLPPDSFIGRLKIIRILRRHHGTHHNPALMRKWNFNVVIPLWDFVRGTIYKEPTAARADLSAHTAD